MYYCNEKNMYDCIEKYVLLHWKKNTEGHEQKSNKTICVCNLIIYTRPVKKSLLVQTCQQISTNVRNNFNLQANMTIYI